MPENTDGENGAGADGGQGGEMLTWEGVLGTLTEEQQGLHAAHTAGLKSALDSERGQRRDLAAQLKEATKGLEEGSDARTRLEEATAALELAERKVGFAEEAVKAGVVNVRLAWLAAEEAGVFDRRGNVDWEALRGGFPELFGKKAAPAGNAGAGTGGDPPGAADMNAFIRRSAGRE